MGIISKLIGAKKKIRGEAGKIDTAIQTIKNPSITPTPLISLPAAAGPETRTPKVITTPQTPEELETLKREARVNSFNQQFPASPAEIQQQKLKDLAPIIGQIGQLGAEQELPPTGKTGALLTVAGTTAAGAGAGLFGGPAAPITVPIGAAVGFISGIISKTALAKRAAVKNADVMRSQSQASMNGIIKAANDGADPAAVVQAWNQQLSDIRLAERILKMETSNSVDRFMSGGMDEVTKINEFYENYPFLEQQLINAISNPDPSRTAAFSYPNVEVNTEEQT